MWPDNDNNKKFKINIMKKNIYILAAMLFATGAFAQVQQGTVGTGSFIDWSGAAIDDIYGLDFNNDGTVEFRITYGYTEDGMDIENGGLTFAWTEGGNNIVTPSEEQWDRVSNLSEGTSVGPNSGWYAQGDAYLNIEPSINVGFRMLIGGQVHYGWGHVTMNTSTNQASWEEIFYQAAANTPITVGDRGGVGIVSVLPDNVKVYASENTINVVCAEQTLVKIYDLSGRELATFDAARCAFRAPQAGVYVVKVCDAMRKVVVF